jgi:hypothetical protein
MRKRILTLDAVEPSAANHWLDLEQVAEVELTSEDAASPIEAALLPGREAGWRAANPGKQVIRLLFSTPQQLRRIRLVFEERDVSRTQEFALRWSADEGRSYRDLLRQQFNFSPPATTRQIEAYEVDLRGVTSLELSIDPAIDDVPHRASLSEWRLA